MPTTRHRRTRHPLPADFASIDRLERVRWHLGTVILREDYTPIPSESVPPTVWPSWRAWAEVYGRCRADFLASRRHPDRVPGSERLFEAYQSDGNAGGDAEAAIIAAEIAAADPRRALLVENESTLTPRSEGATE